MNNTVVEKESHPQVSALLRIKASKLSPEIKN